MAADLDIPVLFRPLGGLLGAAVSVEAGVSGVMVTTQRDHHVQRFTLAHELGHIVLGHGTQIDMSDDLEALASERKGRRDPVEEAAETFASELLASKPRMISIAQRQGWSRARLAEASTIYQLSLRLGVSYHASCWALAQQEAITWKAADRLRRVVPKTLKAALQTDLLDNSWANVWSLSERDHRSQLEASPDDLFVVALTEDATTGFRWVLSDASSECELLAEESQPPHRSYGGASQRTVTMRIATAGNHRLEFEHRRAWDRNSSVGVIDINVQNYGKEEAGLARQSQEALLSGA